MRKRIFSMFLMMFFCVILAVPMTAEENKKAEIGFSLSGGNQNGKTGWMGEFYLAQDWRFDSKDLGRHFAFLVQGTGMAYVYDTENPWKNGEYGASAGLGPEYYFSDSTKIGAFVFVDVLGKNRFYFAHVRPIFMISSKRVKLLGGAAFHLTKSVIVSETKSDQIFWYDQRGYGYDTIYQRQIAETIDYAFIRGEFVLKPFKWLYLDFAGEYNQGLDQYKDIERTELGVKAGFLKGIIAIGVQYFKTQAENVWSKWFVQNGWRFEISFNPFSKQTFGNLVMRKYVDVFWPVVVIKEDNKTVPTKIADGLEYVLQLSKKIFCINEEVEAINKIKGTPPFYGHFDWGDGTEPLDFQTSDKLFHLYHKYAKAGHYCINFWVMDKWGHKVEQCECIDIENCNNDDDCEKIVVSNGVLVVPASAKIGVPFIISWDMSRAKNAETIEIKGPDGKVISIELKGFREYTLYTVGAHQFSAELGNSCDRVVVVRKVGVECNVISIQEGALKISPPTVLTGQEVTYTWNMANAINATWAKIYDYNGDLISTDQNGSKKYTFSVANTYKFKAKYGNNCDEQVVEVSVVVTPPVCDNCDPALPSGSQTDPTPNQDMSKDFYKEEIIQNKTDCDFDNREARFKTEYQSGGGLICVSRIHYLLPKKSQAVIATKWVAATKSCSIWLVRIESLSSMLAGKMIWGASTLGIPMCVYVKFTFADECGANF
ncbi:MAG: hypothetical protein ABH919_01320 [bacterium]